MTKEALKLALEALQVATTPLTKDRQEVLRAITAIKEALAQPEQEPFLVACGNCHEGFADMEHVCKKCLGAGWVNNPQPKEPEKEKKPAAKIYVQLSKSGGLVASVWWLDQGLSVGNYDLYTTPQRKPLTDEEIERRMAFGKTVEAKLKEKNT